MTQPIVLAIETSQRLGGISMRGQDGAVHVEMLATTKRHDDDLLPAIDRLFNRLALKPSDLSKGTVAVSIGPGGFTGLRIAVSTAKMFAETLGVKIVAVPTAMVAAESVFPSQAYRIIAALASKDQTSWCTQLVRDASRNWMIIDQPDLLCADDLDLTGIEAVLGDVHLPQAIRLRCEQAHVNVVDPAFDPRACLAMAQKMIEAGQFTDALTLAPLYPRPPEAVSLWEKRMRQTRPI